MDDYSFEAELENRLRLLEKPDSEEKVLKPLPVLDLYIAFGGFILMTAAMLLWGFCL